MRKQVIQHPDTGHIFVGEWDGCDVDPTRLPAGTRIATTTGVSTVLPSMDFETYSEAGFVIDPHTGKVRGAGSSGKGGLPVVGTPVYAEHPSCEILSLAYDLKDGRGRRRWLPGTPYPADLLDHIARGGAIEAWNITFEFYIWNLVAVRRLGWPPLQIDQCFCAMAKSRRYSMPGALGKAAQVLGTADKLSDGKRLIQKLTRPHTPTKSRPDVRWTPATAWQDFVDFYAYNEQDVAAEDHAAALIPDLTDYELPVWRMDQKINIRGVRVDTVTLDAALDVLGQAEREYTQRLAEVTGGAVGSASEVAKLLAWLASVGVHLPSLDAEAVRDALKSEGIPAAAREVLEIREALASANVKKLRSLKLQVSSDGRLRDQYSYCGADRTGRWSAGGVQLQNITSKGPKTASCADCEQYFGAHHAATGCPRCGAPDWAVEPEPEWTIECVEQAIADIRTGELAAVEWYWGTVVATLCGCLRGMFMAAEGKKFVCVDFSAIEAVAAACLSRCQWRIDVFATHGKIYEMSASKITGTPLEVYDAYKKEHGMAHPDRKKIGKVAELACFTRDTQVLTARGYVAIVDVGPDDKLWDGVEWVTSDGAVHKGSRKVIELDGVRTTPDHPVSMGGFWKPAEALASNRNTLRQALAVGSANLPSFAMKSAASGAARCASALAGFKNTLISQTCTAASLHAALSAVGKKAVRHTLKSTASTPTSCPTLSTDGASSTAYARPLRAARHPATGSTKTTAGEASVSALNGSGLTAQAYSCSTSKRWLVGMTRPLRWTASTLTAIMRRATSALSLSQKTGGISGRSEKCRHESTGWSDVYDIVNAGPRHRFTIRTNSGHLIVHNSGYGGWIGAWRNFGADMDDDEIKHQILAWREASPEIVEMWGGEYKWCGPGKWDYKHELHGLEGCAMQAIMYPGYEFTHYDISYFVRDDVLFCRLPSGRFLHYHEPRLVPIEDKLRRGPAHSITFMGYNSNPLKGAVGWQRLETYGGRLFENVVQAVSRDIQAEALLRAEAAGYPIVMHTHDEGCAEVPDDPRYNVDDLCQIMAHPPTWCQWWPLKAAGWEHKRYQKD